AQVATTTEQINTIEAQAEGRSTVLDAVEQARTRLFLGVQTSAPEQQEEIPPEPPNWYGHTTPPDFVWVGCNNCWTPKDWMRPVLSLDVYHTDGHRFLSYVCQGCQKEMQPTTWGMWIEDAHPWREGGEVAPSTEVQRWGV